MEELKNAYEILVSTPGGIKLLARLDIKGSIILKRSLYKRCGRA
jgi:hypothetical protein